MIKKFYVYAYLDPRKKAKFLFKKGKSIMIKQTHEHRVDYQMIYRVHLEDGSTVDGGPFEYPGWNKCPEGIMALELFLPSGDRIILEGYERYNFFVGVKKPLNVSKAILVHIYGLGCRDGIVTSYRVTMVSVGGNKYRVGDITSRTFPFGKEGIGRTTTSGWKLGVS